jgi:site-specific recombinase XerD
MQGPTTTRNRRARRVAPPAARTFTEWLPFWANELGARGCAATTVRNQTRALRLLARFVGEAADAARVTDVDLIRWRDDAVARGLKASTVNKYLLTVGTFYAWLTDEGVISESPLYHVPLLHEVDAAPAVLSATDLRSMAKAAAVGGQGRSAYEVARDPAILALLQDTGLRASEVAGLLVEHVDMAARQAYVHAGIAKSAKPRTVCFGFQTARLLNRYMVKRDAHAFAFLPELFLGRRGPATYMVVYYAVRNAGVGAGVAGARPHLYRHTWAHDMKSADASDEVLMSLGGWSSSAMPMKYGRAEKSARAIAAVRRMGSPLDRASVKRKA